MENITGKMSFEQPLVKGQQKVVPFGRAFVKFWTGWTSCGRASRSEYWFAIIWEGIVNLVLQLGFAMTAIVFGVSDEDVYSIVGVVISVLLSLAAFIPFICLVCRRLHDIDKSQWWGLLLLVPIANIVFAISIGVWPSEPRENKYGPVPNCD